MLTPAELEKVPIEIQKLMIDLTMRIMENAVDRIRMIDSISRSADYELYQLSRIGLGGDTINKAIKKVLQKTDAEIDKIYDEVVKEGYARDESLYKATGKPFTRFEDNKPIQQLVEAVRRQTKADMVNITQTTAVRVTNNGRSEYQAVPDYLKQKLDKAVMEIASGAFDYNKVVSSTIKEMTKSGIRTIEYESGHHNRVEVAVRNAVMTGLSQVTNQINEMNAEALGTEHFEISWHGTARPSHQLWQGRVYSKEQLETVCGLGTVTGLCGVNCYHSYYPFIVGVSKRTYTDEQLDEMNRKESEKKNYKGREYNSYEATQRQRYLETLMRKQRQDIQLGSFAGLPDDILAVDKALYQSTMQEYVDFSKQMELPQQRERIYRDGLGKVE